MRATLYFLIGADRTFHKVYPRVAKVTELLQNLLHKIEDNRRESGRLWES